MPAPLLAAGASGAPAAAIGFTPPAAGVRHWGQKAKLAPKGAPQFLQKLAIFAHDPGRNPPPLITERFRPNVSNFVQPRQGLCVLLALPKPGRLGHQVMPFRFACCPSGGGLVVYNRRPMVSGHLEQMRANRVETMMPRQSSIAV
jgi:hypothetical protein